MFSLTVCDHIMIARGCHGEGFALVQRLRSSADSLQPEFRAPRHRRSRLLAHCPRAAACRDGKAGEGVRTVHGRTALLRESPNAWAAYAGPIT